MTSAPEVKGRAGMAPRCWACLKRQSSGTALYSVFTGWLRMRQKMKTLVWTVNSFWGFRSASLHRSVSSETGATEVCVFLIFFSPPSLKYFHILVSFCLSSLTAFREKQKQKQALSVPSSPEATAVANKVLTWLLHYESTMGPRVLERPREVSKFEGHLFTGVDLEDSWRREQAASV